MRKIVLIAVMLLALALNTGAGLRREPDPEILEPDLEPEILGTMKPPITTGPDNSALYEKAAAYTGGESLSARLGDPDHVQREFASHDGSLAVTVDADVTIPDAEKAPLIRVTSGTITQADADRVMDTLVHTTLYETDTPYTKAEIAKRIAELEQELAQLPEEETAEEAAPAAEVTEGGAVEGPATERQYLEDMLDYLREELQNAPETVERLPISGQFVKSKYVDDDSLSIEGESESEYLDIWVLDGLGCSRARYRRDGMGFWPDDYTPASDPLPAGTADVTVTADEARALCDKLAKELGLEDMVFYSALKKVCQDGDGNDRCVWALQYTRCPGGVPITYTRAQCDVLTDADVYMVPWNYETLTFYVDDEGVAAFWWEAPYEMGEQVTADAALLDLDEIMDIYEKLLVVAYENHDLTSCVDFSAAMDVWASQSDGADIRIGIDEVRLGYTRIAEMDKEGVGLLVPAWDFFGAVTDGDGNVLCDDPEASLFTVNAVDGDVIDRGFGY